MDAEHELLVRADFKMSLSFISSETEVDSNGEFQLIMEAFTKGLSMGSVCDNHSPPDSLDRVRTTLFPEFVSGSV